MDISLTIAGFKRHLKVRGYADATIKSYMQNLSHFERYLKANQITDLRRVNSKVILDYREEVMRKPLAMESKALRIRPIKRLFEHLVTNHKLLLNPAEGMIETSRKNRKVGTVLTVEEVRRLLSQPNLSLKTHIRDRAIMEVMYSSVIRVDELLNLEVYHVDLKDRVLYIRKGKGGKQRVVPLGKKAVRYLREYLEKIRPRHGRKNPKERRLFLNHSGFPLSSGSIRYFLRQYRLQAGIKKPVSPHTLRRTCATHLLEQGADIRYVQKLLGHKRLSTTQVYTRVRPLEVKKTHDRTHPGISLTERTEDPEKK